MSSIYKTHDKDQLDAVNSQFLIDSWSYSKITSFARNEKAFEMNYLFHCPMRSSATTIAGEAYHEALSSYFINKKEENTLTLVDLQMIAFEYIDNIEGNKWKLQKTTPTVEAARQKATDTTNALLKFFYDERGTYEDDIEEIISVEIKGEAYVTVNGVDIPLPCRYKIDLVVKLKSGKIAVIDHKSKASYTSDDEIALSIGIQAITYVVCFEENTGVQVDEVWFVENKYSKNKDGAPQLNCFKVILNDNTRKLYEALLYEPLRRMLSATNDPDYVYMINDSDNFVDRAELYDFWAKTMISEVENFSIPDAKKDLISKRLKKIRDASCDIITPKIIKEFKENAASFIQYDLSHTNMTQEEKIEHVLRSFGVIVKVAHKFNSYSSYTYLLEVSTGIKVGSIHSHKLDIANGLDVSTVRITRDLVVYEGKSYLGIELASKREKNLYYDASELKGNKIPIGKDNYNNTIVWDLDNHSTPHVLVCGATGSGKSICIKSTIEYAKAAGVDEIIIFDPKYEFKDYAKKCEVINDICEIEVRMSELIKEMNERVKWNKHKKTLIIFDEFADAMANSKKGADLRVYETIKIGNYKDGRPKTKREQTGELKSLEENMRILLQKGRSTGFRIMAATQRASVKVITGDAKVNFPVQICFRVPKETDSRVVLDEPGAESLGGMGDGLIKSPEYSDTVRFQGYFIQ